MEKNKTTPTDAFRAVHERVLPPLLDVVDEQGAIALVQTTIIMLDCLREAGWTREEVVGAMVDAIFEGLAQPCP